MVIKHLLNGMILQVVIMVQPATLVYPVWIKTRSHGEPTGKHLAKLRNQVGSSNITPVYFRGMKAMSLALIFTTVLS